MSDPHKRFFVKCSHSSFAEIFIFLLTCFSRGFKAQSSIKSFGRSTSMTSLLIINQVTFLYNRNDNNPLFLIDLGRKVFKGYYIRSEWDITNENPGMPSIVSLLPMWFKVVGPLFRGVALPEGVMPGGPEPGGSCCISACSSSHCLRARSLRSRARSRCISDLEA